MTDRASLSPPKKKKILATSATKSVKFNKVKTPKSEKKKFAKTPHSSKTPVTSETSPILEKKKRKLSFSDANSDVDNEASPEPSPEVLKPKKAAKQKKIKKTQEEPSENGNDNNEKPTKLKKRKSTNPEANLEEKPSKKKKVERKEPEMSEEEKLREKQESTVFVGNLPPTMTNEGITKAFSKFGRIRSARMRCIPLKPEAKNRKSGAILKQFTGLAAAAFVKFFSSDDAQKALALNGTVLNGNRIRVDLADPSKSRPTNKKKAIFLRNLHFQLSDDELWQAFEDCGKIQSVRIIKDRRTYMGRGLGYVNFESAASVELALKKDEMEIKGRPVKVCRCEYTSPNQTNKAGSKGKRKEEKPKKEKKKKKKLDGNKEEQAIEFKGQKTRPKNKVKKKLSADGLKKKKIAQVLTAKS